MVYRHQQLRQAGWRVWILVFHKDRSQARMRHVASSFNLYMDAMMRKVTEGSHGEVTVGRERVVDLNFADDVALL